MDGCRMTAPTPFQGLLYHLSNAREACHHIDYNIDHQWNWAMAGRRNETPEDMTTAEIDRVGSPCKVDLQEINRLIQIIFDEHMELRDDYYKRIDERNRKDPIWREVHGLPPWEESE